MSETPLRDLVTAARKLVEHDDAHGVIDFHTDQIRRCLTALPDELEERVEKRVVFICHCKLDDDAPHELQHMHDEDRDGDIAKYIASDVPWHTDHYVENRIVFIGIWNRVDT